MDRYTSKHPARNAVAILLLVTLAESIADFACWVLS
jgi:hypothetical protein